MRLVVIAPESLGQGLGVQCIAHRGGLLQRQSRSGMDRSQGGLLQRQNRSGMDRPQGWAPTKTEPLPVGAHPVGDGL